MNLEGTYNKRINIAIGLRQFDANGKVQLSQSMNLWSHRAENAQLFPKVKCAILIYNHSYMYTPGKNSVFHVRYTAILPSCVQSINTLLFTCACPCAMCRVSQCRTAPPTVGNLSMFESSAFVPPLLGFWLFSSGSVSELF